MKRWTPQRKELECQFNSKERLKKYLMNSWLDLGCLRVFFPNLFFSYFERHQTLRSMAMEISNELVADSHWHHFFPLRYIVLTLTTLISLLLAVSHEFHLFCTPYNEPRHLQIATIIARVSLCPYYLTTLSIQIWNCDEPFFEVGNNVEDTNNFARNWSRGFMTSDEKADYKKMKRLTSWLCLASGESERHAGIWSCASHLRQKRLPHVRRLLPVDALRHLRMIRFHTWRHRKLPNQAKRNTSTCTPEDWNRQRVHSI